MRLGSGSPGSYRTDAEPQMKSASVAPLHLLGLSLLYPAYYILGSLWLGGLARSR